MAKKKNMKFKPSSATKNARNKEEINPFELKINKQKHSVLGQKMRNDKGKPGVSRNAANKRRAEIFKKSTTMMKKSNAFIDKRIGECSDEMTKEDMLIERMTLARRKKYKKDIYNLNDEEALTHYGKPLSEIEKLDMPDIDSNDDEDDQLNADFVNKAHFGGFLTKKLGDEDNQKSHKEVIRDLIIDSKKKKDEKKAEKEENDDLTAELDKEWKNFHSILRGAKNSNESNDNVNQSDPYDMAVRELKFEPRGTPAESLKMEEQQKRNEMEKLKKLEEERFERMVEDKNKQKVKYEFSADSIYDGLDIEDDVQPELAPEQEPLDSDEDDPSTEEADVKSDFANFSDDDDEDFEEFPVSEKQDNDEVVEIPEDVEQLSHLLSDKSAEHASQLIANIIKMNHPNRNSENKQKLEVFFCVLLKFVNRISRRNELQLLDVLTSHLFSLTQMAGLRTALIFKKYLAKKFSDYEKMKTTTVNFPTIDVLVALKFSAILYPSSDFRHTIITPSMLLMSDILSCPFKITLKNMLLRLFVSCLFYEYVCFSKRLAVEAIVFLETVLFTASKDFPGDKWPSKKVSKAKNLLSINSVVETEPTSISFSLLHHESNLRKSATLKVSVLFCAVTQLQKFAEIYCKLPSFHEMFSRTKQLCEYLPLQFYPTKLSNAVENLKEFLSSHMTAKHYLTFPKKKPKMLKMFEPRFDMDSYNKKVTLGKKIHLSKQLSKKIKREERSILREVRRDAQFVARKQIEDRMEADAERKRKVKQIYQDLSIQQGECKKFAKKK